MLAWHKPWAGYSAWQLIPGIPAPQEAKVGSSGVQGHPWLQRLHDKPELHRSYLPISNDNDNNGKKNLTFLTAIFTGFFFIPQAHRPLNLSSIYVSLYWEMCLTVLHSFGSTSHRFRYHP